MFGVGGAAAKSAAKGFFHLEPMGVIILIAGIVLFFMKRSESGRAWLEKIFGEKITKEGLVANFFDWPMALSGLLLALPDRWWAEFWNAGFCIVAFTIYYYFFRNKKNKKKTEDSSNKDKAGDVAVPSD